MSWHVECDMDAVFGSASKKSDLTVQKKSANQRGET
jgi:hypothetical protein